MLFGLSSVIVSLQLLAASLDLHITTLKKIDLIDSGMTNLLYTILKHKFKAPETEVGVRN